MKTISKILYVLLSIYSFIFVNSILAKDSALEHMDELIFLTEGVAKESLRYIQLIAKPDPPQPANNSISKIVDLVEQTEKRVQVTTPFKENESFKNAVMNYLSGISLLFLVRYSPFEQLLFDANKNKSSEYKLSYLLTKREASTVLYTNEQIFLEAKNKFAIENNVHYLEKENANSFRLRNAAEALNYHENLYVENFYIYLTEAHLLYAIQSENVIDIEKRRLALIQLSDHMFSILEKHPVYKNDGSLILSYRKNLAFYQKESTEDVPFFVELILQKERFNRFKKRFDKMSRSEKTKEDLNQYKELQADLVQLIQKCDQIEKRLKTERSLLRIQWEKANKEFLIKFVL